MSETLMDRLRYIADSPSRARGGFHVQAMKTAKAAIQRIEELERLGRVYKKAVFALAHNAAEAEVTVARLDSEEE